MTQPADGEIKSMEKSSLILKASALGLGADELQRLAVQRGCSYYDDGVSQTQLPVKPDQFSNEELAVALLSQAFNPSARMIRLAAALMGAQGMDTSAISELASVERCVPLVAYIAQCGKRFEPQNPFWSDLASRLPSTEIPRAGLPHPTRFVEMTGMVRGRVGCFTSWIRPRDHATA